MKILTYIRPKFRNFFYSVTEQTFPDSEIISVSDFKGLADKWLGEFLYDPRFDYDNEEFNSVADDIIARCRTLRNLPYAQALLQAKRYWNGLDSYFTESVKFDFAVIAPVDCYTLDIIDRVARLHGIHVIAFISTFIPGNVRITTRGEYRSIGRYVTDNEVNELLNKMTNVKFLPDSEKNNVKRSHGYIYKYYFRRLLIEYFYYPLKILYEKDPWNYHYNTYSAKGYSFSQFYNRKFDSYFKRLDDISFDPKTTAYLPMHLVPEATTDYWCTDVAEANYDQFILDLLSRSDPEITFIIKEHPAMYGRRKLSFYESLNAFQNVILLHPMDRSNDLLNRVETLIIDNGTVGIEALIRGKRILQISDNYYSAFHPNSFKADSVTMEMLSLPLKQFDNYKFVRKLLEATFKSDFVFAKEKINKCHPTQVAEGIKQYLNYNNLI